MNEVEKSYNTVAEEYARRICHELEQKPLDRQLLERFARDITEGIVADLGCGPGHVTQFLNHCGIQPLGIDLSEGMIHQARRLNPELNFAVGDMRKLDHACGHFAGMIAFYSIVNFSSQELPGLFQEMYRTLRGGAPLLLAFHIGEEQVHLDEWWDLPVSVDFFFFRPEEIVRILNDSGFTVEETIQRDPYPEVEHPSQRAYLFCRRKL